MKKTIRLTESDIRRMVMETMDAWEDAIYKKNQDKEFRHRYGLGQGWPHYDHEDYDNGIWQDDDGKCWTVYPGERQATCLDDEMNENVGEKTIKINESDIRRMVMEALDELDWKTYMNAAGKRYQQAHSNNSGTSDNSKAVEKGNALYQKAAQTFQDQHKTPITNASNPSWRNNNPGSNAGRDYTKYANKQSQYIQGQGWTNESIDEAVTRAIRKYLK